MKNLFLFLGLILLATGCATRPSASARALRADALFDDLDVNRDGFITRAELASGLRYAGMKELDPNVMIGIGKGAPSKKKVKATRKLSEGEIQKLMAEAFEKRDSKLDQRLSKDEFKKLVVERPKGSMDDPWEPFM